MPKLPRDPALIAAQVAKLEAEARKANAEAEREELHRSEDERLLRLSVLRVNKAEEEELQRLASDDHHHTYRLLGQVTQASAKACIEKLVQWSRIAPGCDITIVIDSPGGGIIEGFHLYDTILAIRAQGHYVTTLAQGMAASMAGILLQAGDMRIMSPQAAMLIHEASFGAVGSFGQVEDQVEFVKKLQDRLLGILAERSNLSKTQIKNRWSRKNWWLMSDEALSLGFVDQIAS